MGQSSSSCYKIKRFFTLIELFVVIFLLATIASFFAFSAKDLIADASFSSQIESLSSSLLSARQAALLTNQDLKVSLDLNGPELVFSIRFLEPSSKKQEFFKKPLKLSKIKKLSCSESAFIFYGRALNKEPVTWNFVDKRGKSAKITINHFGKVEVIV